MPCPAHSRAPLPATTPAPLRTATRPRRADCAARLARLALGALALCAGPAMITSPAHADGDQARQHHRIPARARPAYGPEIIIHGDRGFSGPHAIVSGPANLTGSRFNDRVSSVEILAGRWEVCSDPGFRGRCEILRRDEPQLARLGLNDTISSLRPIPDGRRSGPTSYRTPPPAPAYHDHGAYGGDRRGGFGGAPVILFADPGARGRALPLYGPEPHLNPLRFNDIVSSIDVRSGAWLVCSEPHYRGRCKVISGFAPRTRDFGLNDNITSIRPVDARGHGGRRRY